MILKKHNGFSTIEITVLVAILGVMMVAILSFESDIFSLHAYVRDSLDAQRQSKIFLVDFVDELRSASTSSTGSYPIAEATDTAMIFYSDIDNDGTKERIRYFLENETLKKSILVPNGAPLSYNEENLQTSDIMLFVKNGSTPLFQYYDRSYAGTEPPIPQPVTLSDIRLVTVTVKTAIKSGRAPAERAFTTAVTMRNLKDHY
ncbi:MAG TPA: hypothetical protein VJB93_04345 [Patescibacteria group bacterium]|nr:hypothetical protein [Patescibacteria group bacterium]